MTDLKTAAKAYLVALARISDLNDRGIDGSGNRKTSYGEWLAADCAYTQALEELRAAVKENVP